MDMKPMFNLGLWVAAGVGLLLFAAGVIVGWTLL